MSARVDIVSIVKLSCAASMLITALAYSQSATAAPKKAPAPKTVAVPSPAAFPDIEGYWVSLVTEDWRYRMITPGPGEYAGIPINAAAKKVADAWNPAADEKANEQCKSYGAATLMRVPGRLHITRVDAHTLKVEMDNGTQARILHFDVPPDSSPNAPPSWQGYSVASNDDGTLNVVTTNMRSGYLRKNGVPYSDQAKLTEYWDTYRESDGTEYLTITSLLEDPVYLQEPYGFSPTFRKEQSGSKWDPTPCKSQ